MLDFPSSPVIDQTYQGPSGQLWRWTGNMWSAVRRPVLGVTDGSNAAPGEVGEYVTATTATPPGIPSNGTAVLLVTLSLAAGDWMTGGWASFAPNTVSMSGFYAAISTLSSNFDPGAYQNYVTAGPILGAWSLTTPLRRISISLPTSIYLLMAATFTQGSATGRGFIWALRMR